MTKRIKAISIFLALSFFFCVTSSYAQETKASDKPSIKNVIELTIVLGLKNQLSQSVGGDKLSARLQKLIKDSNLGDVMVLLSNKAWIGINPDGVTILLKDEWLAPFTMSFSGENKLPAVEFRNGELGIKEGEIYIKEDTEAKIDSSTYKFTKGDWKESKP